MAEDIRVRIGGDIRGLNGALRNATRSVDRFAQKSSSSFDRLKSSVISFKGAIVGAIAVMSGLKLKGIITDVAHVSGRYEELGYVLRRVGTNAGQTSEFMDNLEESMKKSGIAAIQARQVISKMAATNMDLTRASEMARAAQDLATIAQLDSSAAFEKLIHGVQTGRTIILRQLGLMVDFEAAYKRERDLREVGNKTLSEQEKQLIRTNVTLKAAKGYYGLYEEAMNSAEKQSRSLTRHIQHYKIAFGEAFQPAYLEMMKGETRLYKELKKVFEDPKVQNSLRELGNVYVEMHEKIIHLIPVLVSSIARNASRIISSINFVKDAVVSLWDIMTSIPKGMLNFDKARIQLKQLEEQANKTKAGLKDMVDIESYWQKQYKIMVRDLNNIIKVFVFMGNSLGAILGLMLRDVIGFTAAVGKRFYDLGSIMWYAMTFNFEGIKRSWNNLVTSGDKFGNQMQANWDAMTTSIATDYDAMIDGMIANSQSPLSIVLPPAKDLSENYNKIFIELVKIQKDFELNSQKMSKDSFAQRKKDVISWAAKYQEKLFEIGEAGKVTAKDLIKLTEKLKEIVDMKIGFFDQGATQEQKGNYVKGLDDLVKIQSDFEFQIQQLDRNTWEQKRHEALRWQEIYGKALEDLQEKGKITNDQFTALMEKLKNAGEVKMNLFDAETGEEVKNELYQLTQKQEEAEFKIQQLSRTTAEQRVASIKRWAEVYAAKLEEAGMLNEQLKLKIEGVVEAETKLAEKSEKMSKSLSEAMKNAMEGWASGWSNTLNEMLWGADTTFKDILKSFLKMLTHMVIQSMIVEPIFAAMKGTGPGTGIGGFLKGLFAHKGGIVGQTKFPTKTVSAGTFNNAPRLHKGLRNDEYPAILQRGEQVIPKNQRGGSGENVVQYINNFDGATFMDQQQLQDTMKTISAEMIYRVAPDVIVQNYQDDGIIRNMVRTRK